MIGAVPAAPQQFGDTTVGKRVRTLVARIAGMASNPVPFDAMSRRRDQFVQTLPQLDILDWLLRRGAPAPGFPPVDPLGDALAHVLAVQIQRHSAGALEG